MDIRLHLRGRGGVPRNEIADLYGNAMRNCQAVLQSFCTSLHSYQWCVRGPISLQLPQHLLSVFFILAIFVGVKWYLIVVMSYIS